MPSLDVSPTPTSRSTDRISSHQMERGPAWATPFGEQRSSSIASHPRPALDLARGKGSAKHAGASRIAPPSDREPGPEVGSMLPMSVNGVRSVDLFCVRGNGGD